MNSLWRYIFPIRYHLLDEIEYLKQQLAQKQRRLDEVQEVLLLASQHKSIQSLTPRAMPIVQPKPRGWDEFRAAQRQEKANAKEEPEKQETAANQTGNGVPEPDNLGEDVPTGPV